MTSIDRKGTVKAVTQVIDVSPKLITFKCRDRGVQAAEVTPVMVVILTVNI